MAAGLHTLHVSVCESHDNILLAGLELHNTENYNSLVQAHRRPGGAGLAHVIQMDTTPRNFVYCLSVQADAIKVSEELMIARLSQLQHPRFLADGRRDAKFVVIGGKVPARPFDQA